MFVKYYVIILVISSIIAEEIDDKTDGVAESGHNLNDYFTQSTAISGKMPQHHTDELPPIRRRIRKRKRRPPMYSSIQIINDDDRIEKIRRKSTPIYDENQQISQRIRDPFTALKEAESKQKATFDEFITITTTARPTDLKTILKQTGGGSLSEILQKKNLTLAELLMGNREAISALTERNPTTSSTVQTIIAMNLKKTINRDYEQNQDSFETSTSGEILDLQRKRLASLHKTTDNQIYRDVIKFEVVTEQTTEKRIFIPQQRPNLPITSAKLNRLLTKKPPTIPPNAIKININEIFGYNEQIKKNPNNNGPLRMTIDIDNMFVNTTKPINEKLKPITASDEIKRILMNPIERENLSRILQIRNMTIDELIEQRERGSSQLHLADIFHNRTREPEPKGEISIGVVVPQELHNAPLNRQGKSRQISSVVKKDLKDPRIETTTTSTTTTTTTTPKPLYTITNFPTYKIESTKDASERPFLGPNWREFYTNINADFYKNHHQNAITTPITTEPPTVLPIFNDFDDIPDNSYEIEMLNQKLNDEDDFITLPSGVKSAILASFAIIGGSLLVFLTILMVFKWNQKQKNRFNYNNSGSFSRSRLRTAILESQQKHRSLKSFMNETLGRKKNYYKTHLNNSMSDSIWDKEQKSTF